MNTHLPKVSVTPAEQIQILVDALVATGWRLWSTSHNNTPAAQRVYRWMREPKRGDFVLEISFRLHDSDRAIDGIGELVAITSNHEYTIRTIDGREVRWENAAFVRIPRNEADNREIFLLGDESRRP